MTRALALLVFAGLLSISCWSQSTLKLFELVPAKETGVDFKNPISETEELNVLAYEYLYNGGGVAVGDLNNDGLPDLYFTANMKPNKLYLNLGNFKFKDITKQSGTAGKKGWKTGVSLADVNADGFLDIYVCYSGNLSEDLRRNELYVNNGNLTFTEKGHEFGIDDPGYSTHAVFFDYDRDDDLDLYVLNHSIKEFKDFELEYLKTTYDSLAGDRLYRNDAGTYKDVTRAAGISANPLSFGLGVAVSDLNNDGWPDIYVSNDYREHDYLLINNHDGTFTDKIHTAMGHISEFSMGSSATDVNNDGLVDMFTLDMLPEDNRRQKLLQGPENYELYKGLSQHGFHHQFMRNMLQLNNGDGTFSEIGQLAGISNTDWSWSPLFADFDNDGFKDLFISNGYLRDYTNKDFLKFWGDYLVQKAVKAEPTFLMDIVTKMPSTLVSNYIFKNNGNLTFKNVSKDWGFELPVLSNGAAYADLDNDGDLDLVVNNNNDPAFLYKNMTSEKLKRNFLKIKLNGEKGNKFGLGAKVSAFTNGKLQFLEQMPTQGYQSTMSEIISIGLGESEMVDSVVVVWQNGKSEVKKALKPNQTYQFNQQEAAPAHDKSTLVPYSGLLKKIDSPITFKHVEYSYNDFKRQPLMPAMISKCTPIMAVADVNNDKLDDVFIGAAKLQVGELFIQQPDGKFSKQLTRDFEKDKVSTDADAVFFDADQDGDKDLFVASGSYYDYQENDYLFADRLYINDGKGSFTRSAESIPVLRTSKSCVRPHDFDGDGDLDLFIGGRVVPGKYPLAADSYILINDGSGKFSDATDSLAPQLKKLGLVTDAVWLDLDGNGKAELIIVGEWMPIIVLSFNGKTFEDQSKHFFEKSYNGFWNTIVADDLDNDGDVDLVCGNLGTNTQMHALESQPVEMVFKDFDGNGSIDPFLCFYIQGKSYQYISRDELLEQMYPMRKKFTSYASYADATLTDVLTADQLAGSQRLSVTHLETGWFENENGKMHWRSLPAQAQFSPVYSIVVDDLNHDGRKDILLFGNNDYPRLKFGKFDANYGVTFTATKNGEYDYLPQPQSGLSVKGDVRNAQLVQTAAGKILFIGINNHELEAYILTNQK